VDDLRRAHSDLTVDFNHVYRFASDQSPASPAIEAAVSDQDTHPGASLRVGMIDSAVLGEHISLRDSLVISEEFATHEGSRPLGHGTAVASLIARSAANEAEIHAASVFFQMPGFAPGATTESLIAALDWLVSQEVQVINMSLAGPANELLEEALLAVAEARGVVVAAVGNNGPSGEPLYPAAYDGVIGVTAVDRKQKVFRYANRGDHVDYAALGVDVKVADSGGSWRVESGTSMASPHVAVVVARLRQSHDRATDGLMSVLSENAEDLGKKGFDQVFGYGLITEPPLYASRD
jgi:subtilisin family serine protease